MVGARDFEIIVEGNGKIKQYIYQNPKDKRTRLVIVDDNGRHTSKSYPRILMEEKLGRPLKPNEDVHHIDGNKENNNIENLEIIPHGEHQRMHNVKFHDVKIRCSICEKLFIFSTKRQKSYFSDIRRGRNREITCSRHCSYVFGTREQVKRNFDAECELNGEASPNGNTVPNKL